MDKQLRWGIIGIGSIAKAFAKGVLQSKTGTLLAVASRSLAKAEAFAAEYGASRSYGDYQALLDDADVDAVYVCTPHPMHAEWAIKAARAGKHILCEKPLAWNYPQAMAIVQASKDNDVFLMEAFMYRCNPQTAKIVELVTQKAIGDVKSIDATFSFHAGWDPLGRVFNADLAGGGIMDVGCYCTSFARLISGAATGQPFAEPLDMKSVGHLTDTGVDAYASSIMRFSGDIIATISTAVQLNQVNSAIIYGTEGYIHIPDPWFGTGVGGHSTISLHIHGKAAVEISIEADSGLYAIEADTVAQFIDQRQASSPSMSWQDTLGNMRCIDTWRLGIGLTYPVEKPNANWPTSDNEPLSVKPNAPMAYGNIAGVTIPVSKLVMGVMMNGAQHLLPHCSVMYDYFFENGGNCFDTAYIYGGGVSDSILGQWIKNRGIREKVVVLGKGAHTPNCNPDALTSQMLESLERLQTDYLDIYMMHRDNTEIPVGEFIDVLNEHLSAGRIRSFGGSNWSLDRVAKANLYAQQHGLVGFSAISNNLCLADMVRPVWDGCISCNDPESRKWLADNQMAVMSWSSTGRGFFVTGVEFNLTDRDMVKSWYSTVNFKRKARVEQLAEQKGVAPIDIALAWVLHQPFPSFALTGPASLEELCITLGCFAVSLTDAEASWLYSG